jgi:hypothetical protein
LTTSPIARENIKPILVPALDTIYTHTIISELSSISKISLPPTKIKDIRLQKSRLTSFKNCFSLSKMLDRYGNVIRTGGDQDQQRADWERAADTPRNNEHYMQPGWTINEV